jgi:D-beta-D-heptose 7-phosphate kinase/D-beta-D-heptose 1-phosphate adenosyltransferase
MTTLLQRLNAYRPFRAMVIGDFMLDQHVYGAAERLSPDAPVPVLSATRFDDRPGGAAHVARCLRALQGEVLCLGVIGEDPEGRVMQRALREEGCDVDGLIVDRSRPTTIKRSMVGLAQHRHPQKMFRVDIESCEPLDAEARSELLRRIDAGLREVEVVCIEDYAKGVCSDEVCRHIIDRSRRAGIPVLIDPAAIEHYGKYRGATAITPNRSEAELATGLDTPLDATEPHNVDLSTKLLEELDLEVVVLTLDRHGALLHERGSEPRLVPTVARHVYDVTGAGDVVLATLAGAVANGLSWLDAVTLANAAAGLEVEVFGSQPILLAHLQREVLRRSGTLEGKVRTLNELQVELAAHREAGQVVVVTNGCFDVIHAGHVAYLRQARSLGDVLVVAVNADAQVRRLKGSGRPVYPEAERLEILSELQCVDYLTVFHEPTAHDLLRCVRPDIYVKGGDYQPEDIAEHDLVQELGLDLRVLAHRPGLSSSDVVAKLSERAM